MSMSVMVSESSRAVYPDRLREKRYMSKRLQKGQTAQSITAKKEKNATSLRAIHRELQLAIEDPSKADKRIIDACANQAALTRLHIPEKNIFPVSLGTLKAHAEKIFKNGGFNYLKECIASAKKSIEKHRTGGDTEKKNDCEAGPRRGTKKFLSQENANLEQKIKNNYNLVAEFSDQYSDLLSICVSFIKNPNPNHKSFERKVNEHLNRYKRYPLKWEVIKGGKN